MLDLFWLVSFIPRMSKLPIFNLWMFSTLFNEHRKTGSTQSTQGANLN